MNKKFDPLDPFEDAVKVLAKTNKKKTQPKKTTQPKRKLNEIIVDGKKYEINFKQMIHDYYMVSQHHLEGQAAWRALGKVLGLSYDEARDLTISMRK